VRLGVSERRALKAAILFRDHDARLFAQLQSSFGQDDQYLSANRASRETFQRLIQAEMAQLAEEDEDEPDVLVEASDRAAPHRVETDA
jgi:hypothetical protein